IHAIPHRPGISQEAWHDLNRVAGCQRGAIVDPHSRRHPRPAADDQIGRAVVIDIAHYHADAALGVGENRDEARDLDELTACEPEDLDGRQAARLSGNSEFGLAIAIEVAGRDERTAAEASQDRGWREDV